MSESEVKAEGSGEALDLLEFWMKAVVEGEASDLILRAGKRACCRIDGEINFLKGDVPKAEGLVEVLRPYLGERNLDIWMRTGNLDA